MTAYESSELPFFATKNKSRSPKKKAKILCIYTKLLFYFRTIHITAASTRIIIMNSEVLHLVERYISKKSGPLLGEGLPQGFQLTGFLAAPQLGNSTNHRTR